MTVEIDIKPSQITKFLTGIVVCLTLAHLLGQFSCFALKHDYLFGLIPLVDFEGEYNIPAFYSAGALLLASFLLAIIAYSAGMSEKRHWGGLSAVFLFLAADETIGLHEKLGVIRHKLHLSGVLYHAWVLPYIVIFAVFVSIYSKFTSKLPPQTRRLFILSCLIYVGGAVGFEMIGGWYREAYGWNAIASAFSTVEELMEMAGIIVFIHALTSYIDTELPKAL